MKIENVELTEEHKDSKVTYVPRHAKGNAGHIGDKGVSISTDNNAMNLI